LKLLVFVLAEKLTVQLVYTTVENQIKIFIKTSKQYNILFYK